VSKEPGAVQIFLALVESNAALAVRVAVVLAQRLASDRHILAADPTRSDAA